MRRSSLKAIGAVVAVMALAGFTASSALADGTLDGTITATASIPLAGPCDFTMPYSGTVAPGATVTLNGSMFAGDPNGPTGVACDQSGTLISLNNPTVTFSSDDVSPTAPPFTAELGQTSVTGTVDVPLLGTVACTFDSADPAGMLMTLASSTPPPTIFGPYSGSTTAEPESPCGPLGTADITLANGTFTPAGS